MKRFIYKFTKKFFRDVGNDINYSEMKKIIRENQDVVILDVRTREEYLEKHIDKAVNLPLQDISLDKLKRYIKSKSSIVIVYCEYGGRSRKAAIKLNKMGYVNVYNLEGGIESI